MNSVVVVPVSGRADRRAWIRVPHRIFADDPAWIAPLDRLERRRLSRSKNPFFRFAEAELFIAYRGGEPVGRISAQVNRRHLDTHHDSIGHFGFFETIDDQAVAAALLSTAAEWLRARGMVRMVGPFNFSINEECGLLVDGFETSPAVMMPHSRRWQGRLAEAAGLTPEMDLYAYRMNPKDPPAILQWLASSLSQNSHVTIRSFDRSRLTAELSTLVEIFNESWSANWGFVPFSQAEIAFMMGELRPFFRGHYGKFVCIDGRPVGFSLGVPDINALIAGFQGRLLPLDWLRLGWALAVERFPSGRLPLLGLRREFHGTPLATQMFAALAKASMDELQPYGVRWVEFSWVLASNRPLVTFLRSALGNPVKTYRLYSRALTPNAVAPGSAP